jgi:protein-tyrosine phosphatase
MDEGHRDGLLALAPPGRAARVSLYLSHWAEAPRSDVPDPYYGGPADFERVLDLVEGASRALIARLR